MQKEFRGTLQARDQKTTVEHLLSLPGGAERVRLRLDFPRGPGLGHMVTLSLLDGAGFRGSGHRGGALHEVRLSPAEATPGYLPGAVSPGTLRILLHAHRIADGQACPYRLDVQWEGTGSAPPHRGGAPASPDPAPALSAVPAWHRGDLHSHTIHSDGDWTRRELLAAMRKAGLDFIAVTDHNTVSHIDDGAPSAPAVDAAAESDLLVIAGMELTTFHGHALSLGTRDWIDWGALPGGRPMPQIATEVARLGGYFVIAHPHSEGDPACTGCDWRIPEMMPGSSPAVEVWNGPWEGDSHNEKALALWYGWLNEGRRLVATAGSDAHGPSGLVGSVGRNVVWAAALSEQAILRSIAAGRLYLSSGPHLDFSAERGPRIASTGGTLRPDGSAAGTGPADVRLGWRGCPPGSTVRLVTDGAAANGIPAEGDGTWRWERVSGRWCTVEVRDRSGGLLAVTNPIHLE